jgi:iron-sulfur cluster repair protein YtfE (RIC family)
MSPPAAAAPIVTADLTVNEVTLRVPASIPVFARWGIDSCCGGARTLAAVAERHALDLDGLVAELGAAASPDAA